MAKTSEPKWGDFGMEMNNLLNRIANYAKEKRYTADEVEKIFNAGIICRSAFFPSGKRKSE
jgi:hypothetical protein